LPDTDGQGFVALNGSFEAENRSLIGQTRTFDMPERFPERSRSHRV
jgi:hypothetical protein